jgi:mannose-6-phosphate isomerase
MLYPLKFRPIFKERVWGGRNLERLYGKELPPAVQVGESWEISDREGDISEVANGPLAGKSLQWLMEEHREKLLGEAKSAGNRFPLLIKNSGRSREAFPPGSSACGDREPVPRRT